MPLSFSKKQLDAMVQDAHRAGLYDDVSAHVIALAKEVERLEGVRRRMARAVIDDRDYMRCVVCNRWFERPRGKSRSTRTTCSVSCRKRAYRDRKKAAGCTT
jgi:hypothetical protein